MEKQIVLIKFKEKKVIGKSLGHCFKFEEISLLPPCNVFVLIVKEVKSISIHAL